MQSLPRPDNRLYLGKGGSGKTTLALAHAWAFPRAIICDPNGEDAHAEGGQVTDHPGELVELIAAPGPWRVTWRFPRMGFADGFAWVNRAAEAAGDCALVWDEADLFLRHGMTPEAFRLWQTGRHRRLHIFACSRRPATMPRDLRANLARLCVFRMQEPRDLEAVAEFTDDLAIEDAVRGLPIPKPGEAPWAVDWTEAGWKVKRSLFR